MKKTIAGVVCAAAAALSVQAHAEDAKVLRMACESTYAPFVFFYSETGKLKGFEIDLLEYVAKEMGRKLEVTNMGFDAIIPSMLTGITDVGASAFTITPERAKRVLFSKPYYISAPKTRIRSRASRTLKTARSALRSARRVPCGPPKSRARRFATSTRSTTLISSSATRAAKPLSPIAP